jgi:hypothetical protein
VRAGKLLTRCDPLTEKNPGLQSNVHTTLQSNVDNVASLPVHTTRTTVPVHAPTTTTAPTLAPMLRDTAKLQDTLERGAQQQRKVTTHVAAAAAARSAFSKPKVPEVAAGVQRVAVTGDEEHSAWWELLVACLRCFSQGAGTGSDQDSSSTAVSPPPLLPAPASSTSACFRMIDLFVGCCLLTLSYRYFMRRLARRRAVDAGEARQLLGKTCNKNPEVGGIEMHQHGSATASSSSTSGGKRPPVPALPDWA